MGDKTYLLILQFLAVVPRPYVMTYEICMRRYEGTTLWEKNCAHFNFVKIPTSNHDLFDGNKLDLILSGQNPNFTMESLIF